MKLRDSGMPDEAFWETLFDIPLILREMRIGRNLGDVAELGCGYGTFTVPIAESISGTEYTFDIEPAMVERTNERAAGLPIIAQVRDVMEHGFGIQADAVLLFNILHCEQPVRLLHHAANALLPGGEVLVIHWRFGDTPRGPALDIRPKPEQIASWAHKTGRLRTGAAIELPPWHYGMRLTAVQATVHQ
jgi:SAM-dependent methyltransferase